MSRATPVGALVSRPLNLLQTEAIGIPYVCFFAVCACYAALAEGNALNATRPINSNTDENSKSLYIAFA